MSRLTLSGKVLYNDMKTPVAKARVQIYDLDQGGNGNDKIYEGMTNSNGEFSGLSRDWKDENTISLGFASVPTPDILALEFRVVANGRAHKGPYFHVGDRKLVPIVMPITPPVAINQREVIHLAPCSMVQASTWLTIRRPKPFPCSARATTR